LPFDGIRARDAASRAFEGYEMFEMPPPVIMRGEFFEIPSPFQL